jgi:GMP synthase-like glutamine amidotransferase
VSRVGLLVVGHVDPRARHVGGDYPELFGSLLAPHGVELVPFALDAQRFPQSVDDCDGWICTPSRHSVWDPEPWIPEAQRLVAELVARERPYVGICFGHQLLARALGAEVRRAAGGWEVGIQPYRIERRRRWMQPPLERVRLIASHEDQVIGVPAGAELLATAESCPVAGLVVGERAWSLQGHPEFTPALAAALLDLRVELIGPEKVAAARTTLAGPDDRASVGAWIARFLAGATG